MEREWIPAASALLGARRRDFLAPLWRDIGQALDPAPFDRGHPERDASRAYREGLNWEHMRRSVLAVAGYDAEPVLLVRLAEAHWSQRDRVKAIESWFTLCRVAPEAFEQLIEASDFPDWSMHSAWRVAQEQAVEHDLTPAWFRAVRPVGSDPRQFLRGERVGAEHIRPVAAQTWRDAGSGRRSTPRIPVRGADERA